MAGPGYCVCCYSDGMEVQPTLPVISLRPYTSPAPKTQHTRHISGACRLLQVAPVAKQCWGESRTINGPCGPECSAVAVPFGKTCFVSAYEGLAVETYGASAGAFYERCASPAPTPAPAPAPGSAAPPVSDADASQLGTVGHARG